MNQFPSADHSASWAGVCLGNNESAGKGLSGKARKGSRWRYGRSSVRVLGALPALRRATSRPFSNVSPPVGSASERLWPSAIPGLRSAINLLKRRCHFQDLGVNYFDRLNHEKLTRYFVKRLTRLGHGVTIEPSSASA